MTSKGVVECREEINALFSESGEVAANTTEHGDPLLRSEAPRDFLLDFDHAQIALGLIVVKGDRKIEEKPQYSPLAHREAIQQITRWVLFGSPWFSLPLFRFLRWWGRGISQIAFSQECIIATKEARKQQGIQFVQTQGLSLLLLSFHGQQQVFHLVRPRLLEFFFDESEFSQMMDVAPGLDEAVALIAQESIMDAGPTKLCSDANGIEG